MPNWAFVSDVPISREQYDKLDAELGSSKPEGLIVHAAGESGSGIRIIDVWESKQQFELFQSERLGPAMRKVGIETPGNGDGSRRRCRRCPSTASASKRTPSYVGVLNSTGGVEWMRRRHARESRLRRRCAERRRGGARSCFRPPGTGPPASARRPLGSPRPRRSCRSARLKALRWKRGRPVRPSTTEAVSFVGLDWLGETARPTAMQAAAAAATASPRATQRLRRSGTTFERSAAAASRIEARSRAGGAGATAAKARFVAVSLSSASCSRHSSHWLRCRT